MAFGAGTLQPASPQQQRHSRTGCKQQLDVDLLGVGARLTHPAYSWCAALLAGRLSLVCSICIPAGVHGSTIALFAGMRRCYETPVDKYKYSVCMFKDAHQKDGHALTRLGNWAGWEGDGAVASFTNGQGCWQGPSRSMRVRAGVLPRVGVFREQSQQGICDSLPCNGRAASRALCVSQRVGQAQSALCTRVWGA